MGKFSDKVRALAEAERDKKNTPFEISQDMALMNLKAHNWVQLCKNGAVDIANDSSSISVQSGCVYMEAEDIILNGYAVFLMADPNMIFMAGKHLRKDVIEGEKYYSPKTEPQYVITGIPGEGQERVEISTLMEQKQVFEEPSTSPLITRLEAILKEIK